MLACVTNKTRQHHRDRRHGRKPARTDRTGLAARRSAKSRPSSGIRATKPMSGQCGMIRWNVDTPRNSPRAGTAWQIRNASDSLQSPGTAADETDQDQHQAAPDPGGEVEDLPDEGLHQHRGMEPV